MKDLAVQKVFLAMSVISAILTHIEIHEAITAIGRIFSFLSFLVILVANWERFSGQIKKWFK